MRKKAQYPTRLKLDHKDQNGKVQFISEMETDHIVNLIRFMVRKSQGPQDEFQAQMHGVTITGGAEAAKKAYEFIAPYVMELCVRNEAHQITKDLQGLVRRSDKIVLFPDEPKLIEGDVVDVEFDDVDDPLDYPEL